MDYFKKKGSLKMTGSFRAYIILDSSLGHERQLTIIEEDILASSKNWCLQDVGSKGTGSKIM